MKLKDWLDKNYTKEEQMNLIELDCSDNKLTSLKGIEELTNLEWLDCSNNKLTSLEGIENLDKLVEIYCYDNKLTSLKGIENLDKLEFLDCRDNPLPYSDLFNLDKIKLDIKKEIRQYKIQKMLL